MRAPLGGRDDGNICNTENESRIISRFVQITDGDGKVLRTQALTQALPQWRPRSLTSIELPIVRLNLIMRLDRITN
jgi:hypothetical protein